MGRKTSVYLSDELADRVKASGVAPAELIRRGLDAGEPEPLEAMLRRVLRSVLDERDAGQDCLHPPARVHKGLCGACGTYVGRDGDRR
ncbi:MAG TPA: hypothetical protein VGS06_19540 [Streptosporangiaceae bacterium]|nr:hypothetical protein [Streptosporangiaceae bacterium]